MLKQDIIVQHYCQSCLRVDKKGIPWIHQPNHQKDESKENDDEGQKTDETVQKASLRQLSLNWKSAPEALPTGAPRKSNNELINMYQGYINKRK